MMSVPGQQNDECPRAGLLFPGQDCSLTQPTVTVCAQMAPPQKGPIEPSVSVKLLRQVGMKLSGLAPPSAKCS